MATTSLGSSTTQIEVRSRRGSAQIRHWSPSATLPHVSQKRTRALTSVRASTRRLTSTASAWSRWNAMRWALLGPTPGSRPSSSIRSWTTPSYTRGAYALQVTVVSRRGGDGRRVAQTLTQTRGEPGDSEEVDRAAAPLGEALVTHRRQAQPQVDAAAGRAGWGQGQAPRELGVTARGPVEQVASWLDRRHGERRVTAAPVRHHVAHLHAEPSWVEAAQASAPWGNEALDGPRQVPPSPRLAELDEPRPHLLRGGGQGEGAVHDDIGRADQLVARQRRRTLGLGGPDRHRTYEPSSMTRPPSS